MENCRDYAGISAEAAVHSNQRNGLIRSGVDQKMVAALSRQDVLTQFNRFRPVACLVPVIGNVIFFDLALAIRGHSNL